MRETKKLIIGIIDTPYQEHNDAMLALITALADKIEEREPIRDGRGKISCRMYLVEVTEKIANAICSLRLGNALLVWSIKEEV